MGKIAVTFIFHSGVRQRLFQNVRLTGSWDGSGNFSNQWTQQPMVAAEDETGCDAFRATMNLDNSQVGAQFEWGVVADIPGALDFWAVPTEVPDPNSSQRTRGFTLSASGTVQEYWFATGRRFGAQKFTPQGAIQTGIRFSVWAPYAKTVDVVFAPFPAPPATPSGYIADDGNGIDPAGPVVPLTQVGTSGVWETSIATTGALADFNAFLNRLYMYRIVDEQETTTYKVDIFSRNQVGRGFSNPNGAHYVGSYLDLDGIVSCSVVSDPDLLTANFNDTGVVKNTLIPAEQFWANEINSANPVPQAIGDLVIYELHIGSLGFGSTKPGTLSEAMTFLDQLVKLGVNAVELLPIEESDGAVQWGYGTSLFFCAQTSQGGGNQLKHFIRACHHRGIAVILDVVFNHFAGSGNDRSEWGYDSNPNIAPEHNTWYWYEGLPSDYPGNIAGGYLDNGSSGFSPCFWQENVRQMFTSSAATLFDEFHIDGIRVDLTDAIHNNNALHANGSPVGNANLLGAKLLRELTRTVKMLKPSAFLIAEDYTGWSAMTQPANQGGIGFNALWYMDFYHNLIGDGNYGGGYANLLKNAGMGTQGALDMDAFGGALWATQFQKVAYHESHDEAGNDQNTERSIVTAVNGAPLFGATRTYAEGRCRFAFGVSALSAGTTMFFMGEEVGASDPFTVATFADNKVDLIGQRAGDGKFLFRFYQDLIRFVLANPAARSNVLDVIYTHNENRIIAFTRSARGQQLLVLASLNDSPFANGYSIQADPAMLPEGGWKEVFNSDAAIYGGADVGNYGVVVRVSNGQMRASIPAHGLIVFEKVS